MEKRQRTSASGGDPSSTATSLINSLDDGCLMHVFSFLRPIPDRFKSALVCHRWRFLACHPRLWLRVERSIRTLGEPGVFPSIGAAVSAARPGDTILIAAGGHHVACNIQINKPLCIIGGGDLPDDTILTCSRGSDSALEFLSTCKVANLTVRAELGCCLLHRAGRLTIDDCVLQCEENPLDYLSFAIVSTANGSDEFMPSPKGHHGNSVTIASTRIEGANGSDAFVPSPKGHHGNSVTVASTRIEGANGSDAFMSSPKGHHGNSVTVASTRIEGAKAVGTRGSLVLQHVRAVYAPTTVLFWFEVREK